MRLSKIIGGVNCKIVCEGEMEISSLAMDSRKCEKGALFFCLTGGKLDPYGYAKQAMKRGAVAIVTERALDIPLPQVLVADSREALGIMAANFYGNPTERIKVIGITGTNGKTTTSYMIEAILKAEGKKTGIIGTLGVKYEDKEYPSDLTTPDPIALQETFAKMLSDGVEYVVMEVSAHALFYKKTAGVRFCACIFSNLTQDHLDFFGTMTAYQEAKMRLFAPSICPLAIVNGDEAMGREIGRSRKGARTVFYGLNTPADAFAILTDEGLYGTECMLNVNDVLCRVSLSFSGKYNVYNALSAAACAVELGMSVAAIQKGLSSLTGVKGRMERIACHEKAEIFVDFAHTPDGISKSLESVKPYCKGRLICLFGCGGNRDRGKRPLMGEAVAKLCDFSVLTSDNPRYEDPLDILSEIERGYRRFSTRYVIVPDRKRAIEYALDFLRAGDILLIAGKGGEEYQEIMGIKYPFNDHATVTKLLQRKGKNPL